MQFAENRRELEPKCVVKLFQGSLLGTRWSAIGQLATVPKIFAKVNSAPGTCFSKSPETFRARIKTLVIVAQFLAHKPVNFASLTDSSIVSLSELLKLES